MILVASVLAALPLLLASQAPAGFVAYDERVDGDASDDRFAPSSFATVAGSNLLHGAFGISANPDVHDLDEVLSSGIAGLQSAWHPDWLCRLRLAVSLRIQLRLASSPAGRQGGFRAFGDPSDRTYFRFEVPEGHELAAFRLVDAFVGGAFSFVAIEAGPIITIPADWGSVESPLLGWAHFGSASIGSDLLPEMGLAPGAVGFTGALPAGTYSLWIMELNTSEAYTYSFSLVVTPVPEPGAIGLLGLAGLLARRRRRGPSPRAASASAL